MIVVSGFAPPTATPTPTPTPTVTPTDPDPEPETPATPVPAATAADSCSRHHPRRFRHRCLNAGRERAAGGRNGQGQTAGDQPLRRADGRAHNSRTARTVDARAGRVTIVAARRGGGTEQADFYDGIFSAGSAGRQAAHDAHPHGAAELPELKASPSPRPRRSRESSGGREPVRFRTAGIQFRDRARHPLADAGPMRIDPDPRRAAAVGTDAQQRPHGRLSIVRAGRTTGTEQR